METFKLNNFEGGITANKASSKLADGFYTLLTNGRVRSNEIEPIKLPVNQNAPTGNKQAIYAHGRWLFIMNSGVPYYADLDADSIVWQVVADFATLDTQAERIYFEPIPALTSYQNPATDEPSDPTVSLNFDIFPTPASLLVTDGINQPRLILDDLTSRSTKSFSEWTPDDPEFVPIGIMPVLSGTILYMVSPDGRTIYRSVSGRPLDFVIARDKDGNASVDDPLIGNQPISHGYQPLTAIVPANGGGLIATTATKTYLISPNYNYLLYAEPYFFPSELFPAGANNKFSFVDILGDTAFISSSGIHSFNVTAQAQSESNNFPLGAAIEPLLVQPQSNTAAVTFDTYALFSVNTIYGQGVLVLDRTSKTFISLDTVFGSVKQFAVSERNGKRRLFYITTDNKVFEAYASDTRATAQFYAGDFSSNEPSHVHKITTWHVTFTDIVGNVDVQLAYYADRKKIAETVGILETDNIDVQAPKPFPFPDAANVKTIDFSPGKGARTFKSGLLIEWTGNAKLSSVLGDFEPERITAMNQSTIYTPASEIFNVFGDNGYDSLVGSYDPMQKVEVTVGNWYIVVGSLHNGSSIVTNPPMFQAVRPFVYVTGTLFDVTTFATGFNKMAEVDPTAYIGVGDTFMTQGSAADVVRQGIAFSKIKNKFFGAPGNHDLDTDDGKHFFSYFGTPAFHRKSFGSIDLFFINSGYNTSGDVVELSGNTAGSAQGLRIKSFAQASTAKFKVAVFHHPAYFDAVLGASYEPYAALQWPFAEWGIQLVLNGHLHNYQRQTVDGCLHVVNGPMGSAARTSIQLNASANIADQGFIRLYVTRNALIGRFINAEGELKDEFAVNT